MAGKSWLTQLKKAGKNVIPAGKRAHCGSKWREKVVSGPQNGGKRQYAASPSDDHKIF
jgi:hypothetical protein